MDRCRRTRSLPTRRWRSRRPSPGWTRPTSPPTRTPSRRSTRPSSPSSGASRRCRAAVTTRVRLDRELVRRGLAPSREAAGDAIRAGRVLVGGAVAAKPSALVSSADPLVLAGPARRWASRGGDKLAPSLERLRVAVAGRRCLDAGASTGGFTDVLLSAGAAEVVAVDVGYGQLDLRLRQDPRVRVLDRTNVRSLDAERVGGPVDLTVADLSFISLRLVLPVLAGLTRDRGDLLLLVKPQFE